MGSLKVRQRRQGGYIWLSMYSLFITPFIFCLRTHFEGVDFLNTSFQHCPKSWPLGMACSPIYEKVGVLKTCCLLLNDFGFWLLVPWEVAHRSTPDFFRRMHSKSCLGTSPGAWVMSRCVFSYIGRGGWAGVADSAGELGGARGRADGLGLP